MQGQRLEQRPCQTNALAIRRATTQLVYDHQRVAASLADLGADKCALLHFDRKARAVVLNAVIAHPAQVWNQRGKVRAMIKWFFFSC